jgi:hypothetical protein
MRRICIDGMSCATSSDQFDFNPARSTEKAIHFLLVGMSGGTCQRSERQSGHLNKGDVVSEVAESELPLSVELPTEAGLTTVSLEFDALVRSAIKVIEDARHERRLYAEAVERVRETARAMRENLSKCASPAAPAAKWKRALQYSRFPFEAR